jgi:hypothetical protein
MKIPPCGIKPLYRDSLTNATDPSKTKVFEGFITIENVLQ